MGILRLLLALSVVIEHAGGIFGFQLVGGEIAVQVFFAISGFYMMMVLEEKYFSKPNSLYLFYTNRALRIFPLYWLVLMLVLVKSISIGIATQGQSWSHLQPWNNYAPHFTLLTWISLIWSNVVLIGQDVLMFCGIDAVDGTLYFTSNFTQSNPEVYTFLAIPQAWSISIELLFYLICPWLFKQSNKTLGVILLLCLLARILALQQGLDFDPWTYRFFPFELFFFVFGGLLYRFRNNTVFQFLYTSRWWLIGLLFISILGYTFFYSTYVRIAITFLFLLNIPVLFQSSKSMEWDKTMGEWSYPIYMIHMLVLSSVTLLNLESSSVCLLTIFVSIIFAVLFEKIIGRKISNVRSKRID